MIGSSSVIAQQPQGELRAHQPLLGAVVEVALEPLALLVGGPDEPGARLQQPLARVGARQGEPRQLGERVQPRLGVVRQPLARDHERAPHRALDEHRRRGALASGLLDPRRRAGVPDQPERAARAEPDLARHVEPVLAKPHDGAIGNAAHPRRLRRDRAEHVRRRARLARPAPRSLGAPPRARSRLPDADQRAQPEPLREAANEMRRTFERDLAVPQRRRQTDVAHVDRGEDDRVAAHGQVGAVARVGQTEVGRPAAPARATSSASPSGSR